MYFVFPYYLYDLSFQLVFLQDNKVDHYSGNKLKITPLAFIMKALVAALKKFPSFNSSIEDMSNGKITFKKYFLVQKI